MTPDPAPTSVVSQGYDAVYEAMPGSPTLLRIWKKLVAGHDYPDDFSHISFLTLTDLRQLADALNLSKGSSFADIACGMGGPSLWIARETAANLFGVDLSSIAISQATKRSEALGLSSLARFSVGTFADTGLATASMDAAMTIDALQYAPNKRDAVREFARILRPAPGSPSQPSSSIRSEPPDFPCTARTPSTTTARSSRKPAFASSHMS